jgi:hypothetical protein
MNNARGTKALDCQWDPTNRKPEPFMNGASCGCDKAVYFGCDTVILASLSGAAGFSGRNALNYPVRQRNEAYRYIQTGLFS